MTFREAVDTCHVRSAIYRTSNKYKIFSEEDLQKLHPSSRDINVHRVGQKVLNLYWKNHPIPIEDRVPKSEQKYNDWEEYDPHDYDDGSLYAYND